MSAAAVPDGLMEELRRNLLESHRDSHNAVDVANAVREITSGVVSDLQMLEILRKFREEHVGAGVLDKLLRLPGVTDVLVTAPDRVWIDRGAGLELTTTQFESDSEVRSLAVRLAALSGRRLDDAEPCADGHIPAGVGGVGVRVHAVLSPPAHSGTLISLRVLRPAKRGLADLMQTGLFPEELAGVLEGIVVKQKSFVISGGTGTGKTTLLAAMLASIPADQRVICIEDTPELMPAHPHVVKLVTRAANVEGIGAIDGQDLLKQALRMRPDRIVVGEIRGAEVVEMLAALNTGHRGGAGTVHANRIEDVPTRFEALGLLGGLSREALQAQLVSAIDVVIGLERKPEGRRISQIGLLRGRTSSASDSDRSTANELQKSADRAADTAAGGVSVEVAWSAETGCESAWDELAAQLQLVETS